MGMLITTSQATFLGLSLALAVFIFGAFQLFEGICLVYEAWNSKSRILRSGARIIAIINVVDGVTGMLAACVKSPTLAFTAAIGYVVDALAHITMVTLRWVAKFEEVELAGVPFFHNGHSVWHVIYHISFSIAVLIITFCLVRVTFSYYQVLLVGGTGWERMSPGHLLNQKFGLHELEDLRRDATLLEREGILQAGWDTGGEEILKQKVYI